MDVVAVVVLFCSVLCSIQHLCTVIRAHV